MADEQIVERLAKVDGWTPETRKKYAGMKTVEGFGRNQHLRLGDIHREFTFAIDKRYLESRDALAPVLAKLSPAQRKTLLMEIASNCDQDTPIEEYHWILLTLSPRALATAIATAIDPKPSEAAIATASVLLGRPVKEGERKE